jgi:preprotein translocase subunit SecB
MTQALLQLPAEEVGRLAGRIGASAQLATIGLRVLHWTAYDVPVSEPSPPIDTNADYNIEHGTGDGFVRYRVTLKLHALTEGQLLFELEAAYDAIFQLPEGQEYSDDEFQAFGQVSVFFMLYPYLRSLVHRVTVEGGFPPLILQPIRVGFPLGLIQQSTAHDGGAE